MANYSFTDPSAHFKNGDVIESGNFFQLIPNTEIMADLTISITGGNFTNVKKQAGWTVTGGNWTQVSLCSHVHPEFALTPCSGECAHMKSKDEVRIDGVLIDTIYVYEDIVS